MTEIIFQRCFNKSLISATFKEFGSDSGDVLLSYRKVELKGFFTGYIQPSDTGQTIIIFHSRNTHSFLDFDWQEKRGK